MVSAYNGLSQAVHQRLLASSHTVSVEYAADMAAVRHALQSFKPDLVLCPFLKEKIPDDLLDKHIFLIVHPGIIGDRGPSSIDWAVLQGKREWGIVIVQASSEYDAGPIWASRTFSVPEGATKSRVYGDFVTSAAVDAIQGVTQSFSAFKMGQYHPKQFAPDDPLVLGKALPLMKQGDCAICWEQDSAREIVRKVSSRDGQPGLLDKVGGHSVYIYGAHIETRITGKPREILATRNGAVCFGCIGGAVWITHMRISKLGKEPTCRACVPHAQKLYKLPAATVLKAQLGLRLEVPEVLAPLSASPSETFQDIVYQKQGEVGVVLFQIYNGAMSTPICQRLVACLQYAKAQRDTKVIVVGGGAVLAGHAGYFSNGIDLNAIDFAADPRQEGWANINAIDDVCLEILTAPDHLLISCICGNAGAGGIMMPLGADMVIARGGLVFNPHYATMGLFGSEYWTYTLPRRVGHAMAQKLTTDCLPISAEKARALGMVDRIFDGAAGDVLGKAVGEAKVMASSYNVLLAGKRERRAEDEKVKPLQAYRDEELEEMRENFFEDSLGFAQKRRDFVQKAKVDKAPDRIAKHRAGGPQDIPKDRAAVRLLGNITCGRIKSSKEGASQARQAVN